MNQSHITRTGANVRAILMIVIAMLGATLADRSLLSYLPAWGPGLIGVAIAGLSVYRGWLDQSSSTAASNDNPKPITVTADPDKPLPVTETPAAVSDGVEVTSGPSGL